MNYNLQLHKWKRLLIIETTLISNQERLDGTILICDRQSSRRLKDGDGFGSGERGREPILYEIW